MTADPDTDYRHKAGLPAHTHRTKKTHNKNKLYVSTRTYTSALDAINAIQTLMKCYNDPNAIPPTKKIKKMTNFFPTSAK